MKICPHAIRMLEGWTSFNKNSETPKKRFKMRTHTSISVYTKSPKSPNSPKKKIILNEESILGKTDANPKYKSAMANYSPLP